MITKLESLCFKYSSKEVVKNICLDFSKGEVVSIIGPNGAGKSTVLKIMANILKANSGKVIIKDKALESFDLRELAKVQGYVPQNYNNAFKVTVMEAMIMGRKPYINWKAAKQDLEVVEKVVNYLKLQEFIEKDLNELSGGERQKVTIGRALVQEPEILLLDEPISALDIKYQLEVLNLLRNICKKENKLIVMVMHDLELAARFSDKLILLKAGQVYAKGTPEEVLTEENIEKVYDVAVDISKDELGFRIVPR